jgi:sterol-regulatory element binding protein (SREBP) site 2 protease family
MKIYKLKDCNYSIASYDEETFLIKNGDAFYKIEKKLLNKVININDLIFIREIKDNIIITISMIFTILFTICRYFYFVEFTILDRNFLYANLILLGNIFLHESGHILFLKMFDRNSKFKVGFKFIFIYPAFYVDTSDSYFLPKYKRTAVYLAGNFMNCLYLLICLQFFPYLNSYNYLVMSAILVNFLPIVKSDGYYALMALRNKHGYAQSKIKSIFEDFIRGLIMFLFLLGISKIKAFVQ